MTQLAIQDNPAFVLNRTDAERPPPHRTVTLLPHIQTAYPGARLWLLMGADSLADMPNWVEPARIIKQCRLGVLARPGVIVDWEVLETAVPHIQAATDWLDGPSVSISSTKVRQWVADGRSLRYLLPTAVIEYIQQHGLYGRV